MLLLPSFSVVLLVFVYRKATLVSSSNEQQASNNQHPSNGGNATAGTNSAQPHTVQVYSGTNFSAEFEVSQNQVSSSGGGGVV